MKSGNLNFLEPSGPLQACNGTDLYKLIQDLNSYIIFFKTLGFVYSFLTFNLFFCFIVLLVLSLLFNIRSTLLLGFVPLGYMDLLLVVLQFMLVGLLYLLLFVIILG